MRHFIHTLSFGLLASSLSVASAQANDFLADGEQRQQAVSGFVGAGFGIVNEFEGSDDMQAIPFIAGRLQNEKRYIELIGLGARANILNDEHWQAGPALRFRFGRDNDVDNTRIAQLNEVDDAVEAGAFVRYDFSPEWAMRDSLGFEARLLQDVAGGHEGFDASISVNYNYALNRSWMLGWDVGTSYASSDYMESYFGVNNAESARSGIAAYNAEAGFKDVSLGVNALYAFTEEWGLFGRASYQRLIGDAGDSSLVKQEGNANQFLFGTGVTYRF